MAYIGNTVQNQGFTPAIDYFSGNGSTVTFALSRPVASVAQMIVAIDNVIQNPSSAYTVSGNSITFTSAPLSGTNNIWVEYTSLITTYNAISQDPTVIGDITASGGYLSTGDFGNTYTDGTIVDYVTGNARITTGPADGLTIYNGGTASRTALMAIDSSGNVGIGTTSPQGKLDVGVGSTAAPTYKGNVRLLGGALAANGGLEFLNSTYSNGFGWRLQAPDEGGGSTPLVFQARSDSASWTEVMRINTNGYITTPYRPAFTRYISSTWSGATYTTFSSTSSAQFTANVGSHFNTSNGRFTAPVAGMYVFHAIGTNNNNTTIRGLIQFRINDIAQGEYLEVGLAYQDVGSTGVFKLAAGDFVTIADDGGTRASAGSFMGYLLG